MSLAVNFAMSGLGFAGSCETQVVTRANYDRCAGPGAVGVVPGVNGTTPEACVAAAPAHPNISLHEARAVVYKGGAWTDVVIADSAGTAGPAACG